MSYRQAGFIVPKTRHGAGPQGVRLGVARMLGTYHALHHVSEPAAALSAGRALPTGLVLVEVGQAGDGVHDVCALVHDHDSCRSQTALSLLEGIKVHEDVVADGLGQHRAGGATCTSQANIL